MPDRYLHIIAVCRYHNGMNSILKLNFLTFMLEPNFSQKPTFENGPHVKYVFSTLSMNLLKNLNFMVSCKIKFNMRSIFKSCFLSRVNLDIVYFSKNSIMQLQKLFRHIVSRYRNKVNQFMKFHLPISQLLASLSYIPSTINTHINFVLLLFLR